MKRFLPAFSVMAFLASFPVPTFAQNNCKPTDLGCIPDNPIGFVQKIYGIGLGFIGFVAVIFFIIGAYHILSSQGDPEKLRNGKSYMFYSIAGLLLAVFGYVFYEVVVGTLKVPGFS